jgi:hypothetical protein
MSIHPNVILMVVLTPDNLSRKTYREILLANDDGNMSAEDNNIKIDNKTYNVFVAESEYNEIWQISVPEGSIVIMDMVTYGYGESITWNKLEQQKNVLENWAKKTCEEYKCTYSIEVSANYW